MTNRTAAKLNEIEANLSHADRATLRALTDAADAAWNAYMGANAPDDVDGKLAAAHDAACDAVAAFRESVGATWDAALAA